MEGIRPRKVAVPVANGVEGVSWGDARVVAFRCRRNSPLVGARLGTYIGVGGGKFAADATMENSPGFLFDPLVLPDGGKAVEAPGFQSHVPKGPSASSLCGQRARVRSLQATAMDLRASSGSRNSKKTIPPQPSRCTAA